MRHRIVACLSVAALVLLAPASARAWWNPFKKLEAFIHKLNAMNQGATVKDRWNNLVNAGGAGAPSAPVAMASVDGPRAPGSAATIPDPAPVGLPDIDGVFSEMIDQAEALEDEGAREEAVAAVTNAWGDAFEKALASRSPDAVEAVWAESASVFFTDPVGTQRRVHEAARDLPPGERAALVRRASRVARAAAHFSR